MCIVTSFHWDGSKLCTLCTIYINKCHILSYIVNVKPKWSGGGGVQSGPPPLKKSAVPICHMQEYIIECEIILQLACICNVSPCNGKSIGAGGWQCI